MARLYPLSLVQVCLLEYVKKTPQKQGALIGKSSERLPGITQLKVVGLVQLIDATHRTAVVF
jgi:hypothetical protein